MNNKQLDMVLGYLNEGAEIDELEWLYESIQEEINNILFEDFEIVNEESENTGLLSKLKESIKKVLEKLTNFVKNIVTKVLNFFKSIVLKFKKAKSEKSDRISALNKEYEFKEIDFTKVHAIVDYLDKNIKNPISSIENINNKLEEDFISTITIKGSDFIDKCIDQTDRANVIVRKLNSMSRKGIEILNEKNNLKNLNPEELDLTMKQIKILEVVVNINIKLTSKLLNTVKYNRKITISLLNLKDLENEEV